MKMTVLISILAAVATLPAALAAEASPVGKVIQLLGDLQAKVTSEGEEAKKVYTEFTEWCEDRAKKLEFEMKTEKAEIEGLQATIAAEAATISALGTKIEELAAGIATDEADLKSATQIRAKEAADFAAEEKEMMEVVDTLERAVGILQREMQKSGASMLQLRNAGSIAQALGVLVQASELSTADASRLTALVQSSQASEDADGDASLAAPAAAVYKGQSGNIIETLQDLMEKAETQLDESRKKETAALHNFGMLKQSLEDEIKFANKEMAEAKKGIAGSGEKKASSEGDLTVTSSDLSADSSSLDDVHQTCMLKAQDYEAAVKSRGEELKALAEAKSVLSETSAGAETVAYGLNQVSFLQLARLASGADLANFEAVHFIRDLARKQHSPALAQLASRMASAMRSGATGGADPFAKVKGLISEMISRLEQEAGADATHKAYCDKELSESEATKTDKTALVGKLSTKIDQMEAKSAKLKEQVAALQKALAELASSQAEMDKVRKEETTLYASNKADTEKGLDGVKMALTVLREYYAKGDKDHSAAAGAGTSIIGLLEVIESDFAKALAEMSATEDTAEGAYEQATKENKLEKTAKDQDVKYKMKEAASLDKAVMEASSDRSGVQAELDAVLEYLATLKKQCVAKPETYAERTGRRESEIAGLKEALQILEGEAVLLQQKIGSRKLRGSRAARLAAA